MYFDYDFFFVILWTTHILSLLSLLLNSYLIHTWSDMAFRGTVFWVWLATPLNSELLEMTFNLNFSFLFHLSRDLDGITSSEFTYFLFSATFLSFYRRFIGFKVKQDKFTYFLKKKIFLDYNVLFLAGKRRKKEVGYQLLRKKSSAVEKITELLIMQSILRFVLSKKFMY